MNQKSINWGILGGGGIARKFVHSARAATTPNVVTAVASQTAGKAAAFAREMSIEAAYPDYRQLLEDENIDAVYVANTHNFHHNSVLLALDAGKHVLCEKPLAVNAVQVRAMIAKAQSRGCFLMEAMWTRFLPACRQLMDWIAEGCIGEIRQIEASFGFNGNWPTEGRMFNPSLAGGALLDMGIYPLSFASLVMGGKMPEKIQSTMTLGETGVDVDDTIIASYDNAVTAILRTSFRINLQCLASVAGSRGRVTLPHVFIGQTDVVLETAEATICKKFPVDGSSAFCYEIDHVAECIRAGQLESPIMPPHESLQLAETMDQIRAHHGFQYPFEP